MYQRCTRFFLTCLLIQISTLYVLAQSGKEPRTYRDKHKTTIWFGIRGGLGVTSAVPSEKHNVFINSQSGSEKSYSSDDFGGQVGLSVGVEFIRNLSVEAYPSYSVNNFSYSSEFSWRDNSGSDFLEIRYLHENNLQYFEIPVVLKLDLFKGPVRPGMAVIPAYQKHRIIFPFIQIGASYGWLYDAKKTVSASGSGTGNISEELQVVNGETNIKERYTKYNLSIFGGAGIGYMIGASRLSLELNYRYGVLNITNEDNRYKNLQASVDTFDIPDDIKLNSFSAILQYSIPFRL